MRTYSISTWTELDGNCIWKFWREKCLTAVPHPAFTVHRVFSSGPTGRNTGYINKKEKRLTNLHWFFLQRECHTFCDVEHKFATRKTIPAKLCSIKLTNSVRISAPLFMLCEFCWLVLENTTISRSWKWSWTQSTHRVAIADFWRTSHHDGNLSPGPFQPITITNKVALYAPAETLPLFHLYSICTLWSWISNFCLT
jgi:hypothetical protein